MKRKKSGKGKQYIRSRTGFIDWAFVLKLFPHHRDHIMRVRFDQVKLRALAVRLSSVEHYQQVRFSK